MSLRNSIFYIPREEANKLITKSRLKNCIDTIGQSLDEAKNNNQLYASVTLERLALRKVLEILKEKYSSLPDADFSQKYRKYPEEES